MDPMSLFGWRQGAVNAGACWRISGRGMVEVKCVSQHYIATEMDKHDWKSCAVLRGNSRWLLICYTSEHEVLLGWQAIQKVENQKNNLICETYWVCPNFKIGLTAVKAFSDCNITNDHINWSSSFSQSRFPSCDIPLKWEHD